MALPGIFISYRREDTSGHAGRLFDRLVERFGREHVFRDFETIAAGDDFVEALRRRIATADAVLVVIGPRWLTAANEEGQWRLADERDWVRIEVEAALERNLRVIPVLVHGAAMPRAQDLPGAIAPLAQRNAIEIRDASFDADVRVLLDLLEPSWPHKLRRTLLRRPVYAAGIGVVLILLGVWIYPSVVMTPARARISLAQMELRYDEETFVRSAAENDLQVVRLFLAAGMQADSRAGGDALRKAAQGSHLEMVRQLFERGARDDEALGAAVAAPDRREVFDFLLAQHPGGAALGAALRSAAGTSHTDLVQLLLERGADVNYSSEPADPLAPHTPLHAAARAWRRDHVALLLAHGARVNAADRDGKTAMHVAIDRTGDGAADEGELTPILEALLQKGGDVNARWRYMDAWQPTPLLMAIRERRPVVALWLLDQGADTYAWAGTNDSGLNVVMLAAQTGLADVLQALLARGAPVDLRNEDGDTALIAAFRQGSRADLPCAQALLAAGADANSRNNEGRTALMLAARRRIGVDVIRVLLAAGAAPNVTDKHGWSALMHAAAAGNTEAARELLAANADPALRSEEGEDALMIATHTRSEETIKVLSNRSVTPAAPRQSKEALVSPRP